METTAVTFFLGATSAAEAVSTFIIGNTSAETAAAAAAGVVLIGGASVAAAGVFATHIKRSRFFSIDGVVGASTRTCSNLNAAFFQKDGHYIVQFLPGNLRWADETVMCPLLTTLVQFGLVDSGVETTRTYIEREMRVLPDEARFTFVGDFVGASNALEVFVQLPPELLERVDEVHLRHYVPTVNSLRQVSDKHAEKLFLVE